MSSISSPTSNIDSSKQKLITFSVMLATIMQALDTTIANVALPHMEGAMSATQDQISWVLTSYIVASAIAMPLTGLLSARIGRKKLFLYSIVGFTVTSVLCGMAQSLDQIIIFRLLQGIFGASLVPLSQSILLDTYPTEQHGSAMALWGVGVMVGPVLGPSLGGWLTEYYSWRWVFYINLPFGILAWLGIANYVSETPIDKNRRFDIFGFTLLAIAIGSLQMLLDRGESQNWFNSVEVVIEACLAAVSLYMFITHSLTAKQPFLNPTIFKDKNFVIGLVFIFMVGIILLATMSLLPPYLQNLMGYPVLDVGIVMSPRGLGTMAGMMLVGKLANKVDLRHLITIGLICMTYSLWDMTHFSVDITNYDIIRTGVIQGLGLGLVFVPLSTLTFSTLAKEFRNEGTALYSLVRSIGSSIGISVVTTYLSQRIQINHASFASYISPFNEGLVQASSSGALTTQTTSGLVTVNNLVTEQATILAYLQDFRFMMWICIFMFPLLFLLRKPNR
ncbi:DHA2 family efflux MFS transporter permease subunit [Vibrio sp.]|nr:DHA2 family efflux MFS transporter permease subunit [Vibrio sp.]